jgi:hypothetical protein
MRSADPSSRGHCRLVPPIGIPIRDFIKRDRSVSDNRPRPLSTSGRVAYPAPTAVRSPANPEGLGDEVVLWMFP